MMKLPQIIAILMLILSLSPQLKAEEHYVYDGLLPELPNVPLHMTLEDITPLVDDEAQTWNSLRIDYVSNDYIAMSTTINEPISNRQLYKADYQLVPLEAMNAHGIDIVRFTLQDDNPDKEVIVDISAGYCHQDTVKHRLERNDEERVPVAVRKSYADPNANAAFSIHCSIWPNPPVTLSDLL